MEMNKTGSLIEQLRREKNMTQAELAGALGVSKQAVSNWERGKRFPDVSLIEDIAAVLGLSVAEIIKGERIQETTVSKEEAAVLVLEALSVQKNELSRRWTIVSIMCAALTAMACLGWDYAFFYDKLILLNFGRWEALEMLMAAAFGCVIRRFSAGRSEFYMYSLAAMGIWTVCEAFAAIGFQNDDFAGAFGLVTAAAEAAWFILCGLAGAWITHAVLFILKRGKENSSGKR